MNTVIDPTSEPFWPSVGIRKADFRPHFNGDIVNLYSVIVPQPTQIDSEKLLQDATHEIARWIIVHKSDFGSDDRFQIVLGWPQYIRESSRQVIKISGDITEISKILVSTKVPFRKGWTIGIHPQNTEQGAASNA